MVLESKTRPSEKWEIRGLKRIARIIAAVSHVLNIAGMVVLGLITLLTVVDVIGRAVFNKPLLGSFELTEFSLVIMVFFSIAWCAVEKGHIQVTIITDRLKPRLKARLAIFTDFLGLGIISIIVWQCILEAAFVTGTGKSSAILKIPLAPFYWIMATGFGLFGLQILVDFVKNCYEVVRK